MGKLQTEEKKKQYEEYVKEITPTHNLWWNMGKAFLIGGAICVLGQGILNWFSSMGLDEKTAGTWCSISLVFLSALLTGMGLYSRLAKWGGAGTLVPITGFANSVAAPAVEYQKEGQVFGIGCKIFTIAGPVILYGTFASWILGILYYVIGRI
ncbi:MAG: stage V sporulation protein AC [Oliverpabstia sp.]|nr:stage V sporulation protein AC [Oliverpabstia sp.]